MAEPARTDRGQSRVRSGLFEINLTTGELYKKGRRVALQEQPFRVLAMLLERPGELVTRLELQDRLWPGDTYVGFEEGLNTAIRKLRLAFSDSADNPRFIETVPRRGYRFIAPASREANGENGNVEIPAASFDMGGQLEFLSMGPLESEDRKLRSRARWRWLAALGVVCVAMVGGAAWYWRADSGLKEGDTIVLADFVNSTGDSIFDETLKQALSSDLRQSSFFNLLADEKVTATLKLMNRSTTQPFTEGVAREVCRLTNSKDLVVGSIAKFPTQNTNASGSQYEISLKAVNCKSGAALARVNEELASKEVVLKTLDAAAVKLRVRMGEPPDSVQKYIATAKSAPMPSVEAMKDFRQGLAVAKEKGYTAALPLLQRAMKEDPGFAGPYSLASMLYQNLNQCGRAQEVGRKAYELRDNVSEAWRNAIDSSYYMTVTGEFEKSAQIFELFRENYPNDAAAYGDLGVISAMVGNHEKGLELNREALRLEQNYGTIYAVLAWEYQILNRMDDAEEVYKQAEARNLQNEVLLENQYEWAFLKGDAAKMSLIAASAAGKPGIEDVLLASQAETEAWHGRLNAARNLTLRAVDSALHNDARETAAIYWAAAAAWEVEFGNRERARADTHAALGLARNRDVDTLAALTMARAGDSAEAEKLAAKLNNEFPKATLVQKYWLPTIRAAISLDRNDPKKAVELLKSTEAMDLALSWRLPLHLCPAYVRGEAYLKLRDGRAAAVEFQKFIKYRGLVANFPWGAPARLGLARAYTLEAGRDPAARERARNAYQDFLGLWKEADADVPILKQAKAECAQVH